MNNVNLNSQSRSYFLAFLPYLCIMTFALVVLFSLAERHAFWTGYDTYFHMNGIYEDAMQIKTDHFSYFISIFGFERSGRIVNSLYGPVINYVLGAFLLTCGSWTRFEFWLFFITLSICGSGFYWCARELHVQKLTAVLLAWFYMISKPVMMFWIGNFEFTGLGAADLLPFVMIVGIKILRQRQIRIIPLAVLMAICLQVHLITSVIAVLILVPFTLCGYVLSDHQKRMVKHGLWAVILSFCLSGNIFGAIYDVYSTNHTVPTFPNFHLQMAGGHNALSFQGIYITELGALYTVFLVVIIIWMYTSYHKITTVDWCLLLEAVCFLWISSVYFPWDAFLKVCPELASIIQFPSRLMSVTFLATLLLIGRLTAKVTLRPRIVITVGLLIMLIFALQAINPIIKTLNQAWQSPNTVRYWVHPPKNVNHNGKQIKSALRSSNLTAGINVVRKTTSDYLPTTKKINLYHYYGYPVNQDYTRIFSHQNHFRKVAHDHKLSIMWQSRKPEMIQIPLVKYANTKVLFNDRHVNPQINLVGSMKVRSRVGMNHITIQYQSGEVFKLLGAISVISWLSILLCVSFKFRDKSKKAVNN